MVGQFKLCRLQCTEERFSLVGSSDMLIKVDFFNYRMARRDGKLHPHKVCRGAFVADSSLAVWYFVAF